MPLLAPLGHVAWQQKDLVDVAERVEVDFFARQIRGTSSIRGLGPDALCGGHTAMANAASTRPTPVADTFIEIGLHGPALVICLFLWLRLEPSPRAAHLPRNQTRAAR